MNTSDYVTMMKIAQEKKELELLGVDDLEAFMGHHLDAKQFLQQATLHPADMYNQYMTKWWKTGDTPRNKSEHLEQNTSQSCDSCGGGVVVDKRQNSVVCTTCGIVKDCGISVSVLTYSQRDAHIEGFQVIKKHIYARRVHYREYMQRIQGICNLQVRETEINKIKESLSYYDILSPTDVRYQVRIHKTPKLRGYEYKLCEMFDESKAYHPVLISTQHYLDHFMLFKKVETVFERQKKHMNNRKNFISYPYLFYRLNLYMGTSGYNKDVMLLKDKNLLAVQKTLVDCILKEVTRVDNL